MEATARRIKGTRWLASTAVLSTVAFVLMFLEFPIPALIPPFIKMDVSDVPALLGAYTLGPVSGATIALLKNLLHILIKGTSSAGVGELCNFCLNATFAVIGGLIYRRRSSRLRALVGALVGTVAMGIVSIPLNYFLVYPAYAMAFGGMEKIIAAYQSILPPADTLLKCLVIFNLPFTCVKGLIGSLFVFFIYKPLTPILSGRKA